MHSKFQVVNDPKRSRKVIGVDKSGGDQKRHLSRPIRNIRPNALPYSIYSARNAGFMAYRV